MIYLNQKRNRSFAIEYLLKHKLSEGVAYYDQRDKQWYEIKSSYDFDYGYFNYRSCPVRGPRRMPKALMACVF